MLDTDKVMALQMSGMTTRRIAQTTIEDFEDICCSNPIMEEYLFNANRILNNQEALGIDTITVQDVDFPPRLKVIGEDCPAVIALCPKVP